MGAISYQKTFASALIRQNLGLDHTRDDLQSITMITMLSLFAQLERLMISQRTKEALAAKKAQGVVLGKPKGTLQQSIYDKNRERIVALLRLGVGGRTSLSCISKGVGDFCSRLLSLRTGQLSSAFRLQSVANMFGHPTGDILDSNRGQRLGHAGWGEFTAHTGNQEDGLVQFATTVGLQTLFGLANQRFDHIT